MKNNITIQENKKDFKSIFGATGIPQDLQNKDGKLTEAGDYKNFDYDNRFKLYQQLYTLSPYIYISFNKFGLNIVKNVRFEGKSNLVKNFEKWSEEIMLLPKLQTMARLIARDGTYIALITDNTPDKFNFEPLLMSQVTMIPSGYTLNTKNDTILMPPVTQIVVNESDMKPTIYRPDEVFRFALSPREKVMKDSLNRDTFGIYGISLMDSVIDTLMKYIDLVSGYTHYIKRYGIGRYHINYNMLTDLVKEGQIEVADALEIMQDLAETHTSIKENEDIVGLGFDIKQLEAGSANIDVTGFKESLECDIQIGLLQSPVTMGKSAGSTFASAYVSEDDRILSLEGIQRAIMAEMNSENGIIGKRLKAMGKSVGDVKIVFEELSTPKLTEQGMFNAVTAGIIAPREYRKFVGMPEEVPNDIIETKQEKNTTTNNKKILESGAPDDYPKYPSEE